MILYLKSTNSPAVIVEKGQVVIDNFGLGMFPVDIRRRLSQYDQIEASLLSEENPFEILLCTQNPVAIDSFVREHGYEVKIWNNESSRWVWIYEAYNPDWLAHFQLGDLYNNGELEP